MNGNLIVGGIIVIVIAVALYVVIRNKKHGKPSCGCNRYGECSMKKEDDAEECDCGCCRKD